MMSSRVMSSTSPFTILRQVQVSPPGTANVRPLNAVRLAQMAFVEEKIPLRFELWF